MFYKFRSDCTNCVAAKLWQKEKQKQKSSVGRLNSPNRSLQQELECLTWWSVSITMNWKNYLRTWKHLNYFECKLISKAEFVLIIARFLLRIGKGNGLKCKMSVFIRYLASNEHSDFNLKYRSLNTLIYRMLEYLESQEKEA